MPVNQLELVEDIKRETESVAQLIGMSTLSVRVMQAIASVPREEFVPDNVKKYACENSPLPIGYGQTISQPFIVALMTELIEPKPDDVVLDIGTGSGYQAAILSKLVGAVYSVEIISALAESAKKRLVEKHYDNVHVHTGNGYFGWPEHSPYDAIIVAAATPHIPQPLIDQLRVGGRLVIPIGREYESQVLVLVTKTSAETYDTKSVLGVIFVPLTGDYPLQPTSHVQ